MFSVAGLLESSNSVQGRFLCNGNQHTRTAFEGQKRKKKKVVKLYDNPNRISPPFNKMVKQLGGR